MHTIACTLFRIVQRASRHFVFYPFRTQAFGTNPGHIALTRNSDTNS